MSIHKEQHPLAGRTVKLAEGVTDLVRGMVVAGVEYEVEDWWDRVSGGSWMLAKGNPAAMQYAMRSGFSDGIPLDNEVVYGHIGHYGHIVHTTELEVGDG